jgi:hypothetical protein
VIGHQRVGVQAAALPLQGLVQPAELGVAVPVVEEAGAAVVAAPHDMQRHPVEMDARTARHAGSLTELEPGPFSRAPFPGPFSPVRPSTMISQTTARELGAS